MDERHAISELGMRCGYRISPAERLLQLEYISTKGLTKTVDISSSRRTQEQESQIKRKKENKDNKTKKSKYIFLLTTCLSYTGRGGFWV